MLGERGEPDDVGKEDRDEPALAGIGHGRGLHVTRPCVRGDGGNGLRSGAGSGSPALTAETGTGIEWAPAVTAR